MKKTLLVALATISTIATCGLTYADTDCSTLSKDTIKTILDKQKAWTTLTDSETTLLASAKECMPSHSWALNGTWSMNREKWEKFGSGKTMPEMTDEQKAEMEAIKTILEKQKAWTTLTDEEQATLDAFEAKKTKMWSWMTRWEDFASWSTENIKTDFASKLKTSHKNSVDKLMTKFENSISSKTETEQQSSLEALLAKVEKAITKIENSSYSDTKKETYTNILEYLQESIEDAISDLEDAEDDTDSTLSELGL